MGTARALGAVGSAPEAGPVPCILAGDVSVAPSAGVLRSCALPSGHFHSRRPLSPPLPGPLNTADR